ncbi:MAG: MarR family EPS-associated transcriptional regulator [Betaproteobacteria bacterium]
MSKSETAHFRVLRALEVNPELTQRELADQLGVSLGAVNYCLSALVEKGHVKIENFKASESKWRYLYVLTPQGVAERAALTGRFLARKLREFEQLKAEIDALTQETRPARGRARASKAR